ncbi:LPS-assembly protein [Rhizobium aquaticum]|uniref:LPS-assembly protein LptD n=2 Tax=Rhizobium aquaticum TaxID=1549636 RepID=A0ABV2IZL1_9HYPH
MAVMNGAIVSTVRTALLAGVAACAFFAAFDSSVAQEVLPLPDQQSDDATRLYLSSNQLVYDRDHKKVTASGAVKINYKGHKLVADNVTYDQASGRLIADGKIEVVEPDGNKIYADKMDVTDDFGQGFINSLRIETTDDTHIAAESGQRVNSTVFVLQNGVYTACKPCADQPEKAPLWQVKARKVIENGETHTVRLEGTRLELFGMPIAYLPFIEVPDHTVKRKSGFLFPTFSSAQNLGFGATVPYYYVINPSTDFTFSPTVYSTQGLLLTGELRQRFDNGTHTLQMAGISQMKAKVFAAGTSDSLRTQRGMVRSTGNFQINPRWTFGWDVMAQTDNNFSRTYSLKGLNSSTFTNQIYLTGLGKRNYFDVRSYYFDVQDADPKNTAEYQQAFVHPVLDYNAVLDKPVAGGELSYNLNFTNLTHRGLAAYTAGTTTRFPGVRGETSRLSADAQWRRRFVSDGGLVVTPVLAARADAFQIGMKAPSSATYTYAGSFYSGVAATRSMITAGTEVSYPFLITMPGSQHIIEPVGQIFIRPDEQMAGRLPNEDSQSFVFDATNLFDRDKFAGYDRIEGGTRANLGIRYKGTFDSGYSVNAIAGESFQVAGRNSFAQTDLVYAGWNSGLDKKASDYVGMINVQTPFGLGLTESLRLKKENFQVARLDSTLSYSSKFYNVAATYSRIGAQPEYGAAENREQIILTNSVKFKDYWKLYGTVSYDLRKRYLNSSTVGLSYEDECTIFAIGFTSTRDTSNNSGSDWAVGARLTFRTLGDVRVGDATSSSF